MDFWALYGVTAPAPDPTNPPPACVGQIWVRNGSDCAVSVVIEEGERVPYCWGVPQTEWPPADAILVSGPHSPWRAV